MAACRRFYSVRYIRLPELLNELAVARGMGVFEEITYDIFRTLV